MFPNVRLMIATTFASVVALICGFVVFAAFHVSREPLMRPSAAAAPLLLVGGTVAALPIAAAAPFDDRLRIGGPESGGGISALAYSSIQANEPPVTETVAPAADDHESDASKPAPVPADSAAAPTLSLQTANFESAQETKPDDAAAATRAPAPASALNVANVEVPPAESPAGERAIDRVQSNERMIAIESALASPMAEPPKAKPETPVKVVKRKTKHTRLARAHRIHRVRAVAVAANSPAPVTAFPFGIGGPLVSVPKR
jgi:hypothetical protein